MKTKKYLKDGLFLTLVFINIKTNEFVALVPSLPKKTKDWVEENKDIIIFWIIFSINLVIKSLIDARLTPIMMIRHGYIFSFITTNIIYALIGILFVILYDVLKKDILMLEALKKYQNNAEKLKHKNKLIKFILKKNKKHEFVLNGLLFFKNPAFMVIYKRTGFSLYNGFNGKNIKVFFFVYLLIMNLYWNTVIYIGIHTWNPIFNFLKEILIYLTTTRTTPFF